MDANLKISIENKKFYVSIPEREGCQYALYIKHKRAVQKYFYQQSPDFLSSENVLRGLYTFTMFYQNELKQRTHFVKKIVVDENQNITIVREIDLKEDKNYKITVFDIGAKKTFIVFNGGGSTKQSQIFALDYLLSNGINVIGCWQDNNNNYQDLSLEIFERAVKDQIENQEVYLYGSSLGGYCAFYYAGVVNGTVIAAAPINSQDPNIINASIDKSLQNEHFVIGENVKENMFKHESFMLIPKTNKKCFVFIDPLNKTDIYYLHNVIMPTYQKISLYEFPFAGHTVLYHINKTKQLDHIIKKIVNGENFNIDINLLSEFIYYEKAKYYLSKAQRMTKNALAIESVNPLIKQRIESLIKKHNI